MRLVAIVTGFLLLAAPAAAVEKPALTTVSSRTTIVVRGTHFVPYERVTVRVIGQTVVTKRTSATARGSFRLALDRPKPRACNSLVVRATGARGDWAVLRIRAAECNPPGESGSSGG
jgi:hypothetical protein